VKLTFQELDDSAFDLEAWFRVKFGQRYGRAMEKYITQGDGAGNNIASIVTTATLGVTAVGNGTAAGGSNSVAGVDGSNSLGYDDISGLYAALDPAYLPNATWTMNSATRGYLLGVKDSFGRPLFIPNPTSGAFDTLIGRPVVLNQSLANIGPSNVPVQFGDYKQGYLFRTDGDFSILRLNERFADQLEVGILGYIRVGGMSTDAGTHPLLNLVCAAS
jgi:HK97 family phage major capsid protein